ncbi:MAG: hypothetical protein Q7R95_08980 [bacterium]|nr:hypothetical protein [bacterium]
MVVEQVDISGFATLAEIKRETDGITEENKKKATQYLDTIRNHCEGLGRNEMPYTPIIGLNGIVLKGMLYSKETDVAEKGRNVFGHAVILLPDGFFTIEEPADNSNITRLVAVEGSAVVGHDVLGHFIEKTSSVGTNPPGGSTTIRLGIPKENQVADVINQSLEMAVGPLQRRNDIAKQGRANIIVANNFISPPPAKK